MSSKRKKVAKGLPERKDRRLYWLLLVLFITGTAFFFLGGSVRLSTSLAEASILKRRLESAERWLDLAEGRFGDQGRVQFLRGRVSRLNGDFPGMVEHLINAHQLGYPAVALDREQLLANLSIGEMDANMESLARDWIAELPPDVGLVVDALANGLASQSRFEEAAKLLGDYEQAFPDDPMVNYRLGVMIEHIRGATRADKAEEEYIKALEKDPGFIQAAWRLARIKTGQNKPDEAIAILRPVMKGRQELAVKTFLAHCLQQAGKLDESRDLFKEVADFGHEATLASYRSVDEVPERFLAASSLGVLLVKLGEWEEAKKYLEMALDVNPRDFVARNSYAQVLRRLGLHDQAEQELARIVEEREEYDKITVLRDQINQDQSNTEARVELGKILFKYESEKFGLFWVRSAFAYDPQCQAAHRFMGDYYDGKARQASSTSEEKLYRNKASYHFSQLTSEMQPTS